MTNEQLRRRLAREYAIGLVFVELTVYPSWEEVMRWLESWADQDPYDTASSKFNDVTTDYCVYERYEYDTVAQLIDNLYGLERYFEQMLESYEAKREDDMSVVTAVNLASLRGQLIKAVREGRLEVIVACTQALEENK